ncbi:MAG: sigma-54-dependent Fis family transcriptional regulator [Cyclobacteriaceae bacterium]|nr:sigma-54-dependent Fis family transcriptional regulator [Cyclobacteriaceae bacterium]
MNDPEIQNIKQRFGIIGNSPLLNHAIEVAGQVAPTDMTVLITGESGSGKESFSKIIHHLSVRKHGKFIAINCGAIPEGTIDSELFGHEKGSFTGAHEARKGYFEVTDNGTIFLDEIGELPMATQARLLRVLEYGEFIKVGSSKVLKTNVRVVTATNINLLESVENGKFRQDLYYRLNTVPIYVPALRERGSDIVLLFRKFASDFSEKYKVKSLFLTEDAKIVLTKYRFPGNIRQLKNLAEQISVLEINREVTSEKLLKYLPSESNYLPALYRQQPIDEKAGLSERDLLYKVLFDMRKDVNELKKLVHGMISDEIVDQNGVESTSTEILRNIPESKISSDITHGSYVIDGSEPAYDVNNIEDISHETERDESLSIEAKEKELIIKALRKNNNKRKYAARDLGISERTLYRKIKQFEIDD